MDEQTKADLREIAASVAGRNVLRYIAHEICGVFADNIALTTTHEVSASVMISRESQRGIWLDLRKHIPRKDLIEIELYEPQQPAVKADNTPVTEDELPWQTTHQQVQQQTQEQLSTAEQQPMAHRQRPQRKMTELS